MKLVIGADHAGYELKEWLKKNRPQIEWMDVGTTGTSSVDYPDYADLVVHRMKREGVPGVLICGSGQGMAMRANKHPEIRAALVWDQISARLSREHNNANILCLGGRLIPFGLALECLDTWLTAEFLGGRHETRVKKINSSTP